MNETKFDFTYFFETLVQRILYMAMNLPIVYTTILTVFILALFNLLDNTIILYAALVVGFGLKILFTVASKVKKLKTEVITIIIDIILGLLVVLISGFIVEYIILGLTVLYLIYYSFIMTISYTRLAHNTEEILHDLRHRHDRQTKKSKKR